MIWTSWTRVTDSVRVFYVTYSIQTFHIQKFIFHVKLNHFVQSVNHFTFVSIFFLMAMKFFYFNFDDTHLWEGWISSPYTIIIPNNNSTVILSINVHRTSTHRYDIITNTYERILLDWIKRLLFRFHLVTY